MSELLELLKEFKEDFVQAPLYGGYSRTLKRKIDSKQQVKMAFIENVTLMLNLSDDPKVVARINGILKNFE